MEGNLIESNEPKIFVRSTEGSLLEKLVNAEPLDKRPTKHERLEMELEKGFKIKPVKYNNKFYLYRIRS